MLLAVVLGGIVAAFKGIDRDGDLLLFGGAAIAWVGPFRLTRWLLLHLPAQFCVSVCA